MVGYSSLGRDDPAVKASVPITAYSCIAVIYPENGDTKSLIAINYADPSHTVCLGPATLQRIDGLIRSLIELKKHCHR